MQIGFIGLGKMGSRMVRKLVTDGHKVYVWNRSKESIEALKKEFGTIGIAESLENFTSLLKTPRVLWTMLPAGEATETILAQLLKFVEKNDIVIDGGNSYFKDTDRWYKEFKKKGIRFLGIGVSGGLVAFEQGYPLMVGGDKSAYDYVQPLLNSLSKPKGGYEYFGEGGAGHFVKMVHNGIEYGYMQSIGEGFGVLNSSRYSFDLLKVAKLYQKGTLISGFMMDRTAEALEDKQSFDKIQGVIGMASKEAIWTIEEAKKSNVPIEIIEKSLEFRKKSETDSFVQKSFAAKMVAALRKAFGGHKIMG